MVTLFLDFDGVLHPEFCHDSKHFSCLPYFENALRLLPEASVVITSTWRLQCPIEHLQARFSPDVAPRVFGATPEFNTLEDVPESLLGYEREAECDAWLRTIQRAFLPWLAIDDRSWLFRPFSPSLFLIDGQTSFTPNDALKLVRAVRAL